ncbi:GNAT family N-acetyltransferase [Cohnella panacarvi]|uniref:GNAT family N-acetyltransferase n=1 Tax=Cohnella panacarvi TaxID=400776 RepID=UPI00047E7690|nr:GNAT family N-acetyltransferase [Cohnella panacarvi]
MKVMRITTEEMLRRALAIRMTVFVDEQGVPADLEKDEYDATPEAGRHHLLTVDGQAIATGRWKTYEPGVAKMQRIAVLKSYRGRGYGSKLLESMEDDAKASGYHSSLLDAQCSAEAFYRKLGYDTVSDEPFLDAGILHVRMLKKL